MILLVSYDLNGGESSADYGRVRDAIEKHASGGFVKILYSQWLVDTDRDPAYWDALLEKVTDASDRHLIAQITYAQSEGRLPSGAWDWFKARR